MALSFTKATWKHHPDHDVEYCNLQAGNKFVRVETETKVVNELIKKENLAEGYFKDVTYTRDFLLVSYPQYDVNEIKVNAEERDQYFLVVNHTIRRANPVLKHKFEWNYSPGGSGKIIGDSKVHSVEAGAVAVNPDEDKKAQKQLKDHEKKHKSKK